MKIEKGVLISIEENDIKNGVLELPKRVKKIGDNVLNEVIGLEKIIGLGVTTIGNDSLCFNSTMVSLELPNVTTIGNYSLSYNSAMVSLELPNVTTIGNDSLSSNSTMVSLELPNVTTIGNYSLSSNSAMVSLELPNVTTIGDDSLRFNSAMVNLKIKNKEFKTKCVDGYLFIIESEKITKGIKLYSGYNFVRLENSEIKKEVCFIAEKDNFTAHGNTIKKAFSDLEFKLISEKLKKEPIKKDTIITINYYRLITGACEFGVNSFIENTFNGKEKETIIKNGILAKDLLPILEVKGAYGLGKFKQLLEF